MEALYWNFWNLIKFTLWSNLDRKKVTTPAKAAGRRPQSWTRFHRTLQLILPLGGKLRTYWKELADSTIILSLSHLITALSFTVAQTNSHRVAGHHSSSLNPHFQTLLETSGFPLKQFWSLPFLPIPIPAVLIQAPIGLCCDNCQQPPTGTLDLLSPVHPHPTARRLFVRFRSNSVFPPLKTSIANRIQSSSVLAWCLPTSPACPAAVLELLCPLRYHTWQDTFAPVPHCYPSECFTDPQNILFTPQDLIKVLNTLWSSRSLLTWFMLHAAHTSSRDSPISVQISMG